MALELSAAARELLLEASRDPGGLILRLSALGGIAVLKTNGRIFGDGTAHEQARWESAVRELASLGLVEPQGHRVYCMTNQAYEAARLLRGPRA